MQKCNETMQKEITIERNLNQDSNGRDEHTTFIFKIKTKLEELVHIKNNKNKIKWKAHNNKNRKRKMKALIHEPTWGSMMEKQKNVEKCMMQKHF